MTDRTKVVATTTDFLLAHLWRDLLESAGIQAQIFGGPVGITPVRRPAASATRTAR